MRSTRQRELVFGVLMELKGHPTADEVYVRAREQFSSISLATVYNCLEALVDCGLVKAVHRDREPARYCANLVEHAHFHDLQTGEVRDVLLPSDVMQYLVKLLPKGCVADRVELNFIGRSSGPTAGEAELRT